MARSVRVQIQGRVTRSERRKGAFTDDAGRDVSFDFIEARVLQDDDATDVRFPSDGSVPVPGPDELVMLVCDARPAGRDVRLTVVAVQPSLALA